MIGKTYNGHSGYLGAVSFKVTRVDKRRVHGHKTWTNSDGQTSTFPTSMTHREFERAFGVVVSR